MSATITLPGPQTIRHMSNSLYDNNNSGSVFNVQKRARMHQSGQEEIIKTNYVMIDATDTSIPIDQNIDNEEDETVENDEINEEVESFFHSQNPQHINTGSAYNR